MVLVGSSIPAAWPVVMFSWLKVGVIAAKALNNVFNNESIESVLVLDCPPDAFNDYSSGWRR
jgi:hypothetical protein